jgi:formylglycine-generating enzyme required for sulfatase activity
VPVVGVTWYEAIAYCRWLTEQKESPELQSLSSFIIHNSSFVFRLPTEPEWILAAGAGTFAWGEIKKGEEITRYANTGESGIGRTTPAGMYPLGRTKDTGIWDMSGNVWEWQTNFFDKDHDVLGLRGGSWDNNGGYARLAARYGSRPYFRWNNYGFRVVLASPPM